MPAPFPYDSQAGVANDRIEAEARNLILHYSWVARLVDEMNAEVALDLKRTMQLVLHGRQFRRWYEELNARIGNGHTQAQIADVLEAIFLFKKMRWPTRAAMNADLAAIYNACGVASDWFEANVGTYKNGYSINREIAPGVMTDEPIKVTKTTAIATRLSDFRALFGPKG